ncbi:MAG: O-succinylbenzoic acid--CoA ligase, partial [Flavobacteriaceae bacterium]|nr:O-succinylbenzoic acid--CoA ligase [Flavobacteriaceae bacterium]
FTAMVPLQLFNSLKKIKKIKTLIVGGGVVTNNLQSKILDLPTRIFATYGMTETITHIAIKPLNKSAGLTSKTDLYQTLPYVNISSDERNCLVIDAPKISEERFITNDIVELIPDDKFKWLGRYDNIINSGGVKLIPEQIEGKLSQIISQRFFVIGIPDEVLGEKLILIIEGCVQNNLKSQISNLKSIDKFDVPKEIYFIDNFVETETKKIQRDKTLDLLKI